MVFDKQWFQQHQKKLLWFCNHPLLKYWFRRVLRIHKDLKWNENIESLEPNNYRVRLSNFMKGGKLHEKLRVDFRTHNKFSARMYYGFKPIWYVMHSLDWICLDKMDLSFGFGTLTVFPDAGSGGDSVDGFTQRGDISESFSTIRSGAGTFSSDTSSPISFFKLQASTTSNEYKTQTRSIYTFDTSPLGASATIDSAIMSLFGTAKFSDLGTTPITIVSSTPASDNEIIDADYSQRGSTSFSTISFAAFSTSSYNDFTLNSSGESNISLTGVSKFAAISEWDFDDFFDGTWSSEDRTEMQGRSSDHAGTSEDPKLVIEFSVVLTIDADETVTINDVLELETQIEFTEVVTIVDTLETDPEKVATEVVTINDTLNFDHTGRIFSETVVIAEDLDNTLVVVKQLTETITINDDVITDPEKVISLAININDVLELETQITLTDRIQPVDTLLAQQIRVFSETISVNDSIIKDTTRDLLETVVINDILENQDQIELSESISLTDSFSTTSTTALNLTEQVIMGDDITNVLNESFVDIWTKSAKISTTWIKTPKT